MHVFFLPAHVTLKGMASPCAYRGGKGTIPATVARIDIYTSLLDAVKIIILSG